MKTKKKKFDIILCDNKYILIAIGTKNTYELAECEVDNISHATSWLPCNMNIQAGYAWLSNDKRPYGHFIKHGFLKTANSAEYMIDKICISDGHFNTGQHKNDIIDHIIVKKRKSYNDTIDDFTFFKIENGKIYEVESLS